MNACLLILIAPPANEEAVIDWLLQQESISGFTGLQAYGHSSEHARFSLAEQVTGRQQRVRFEIETNENTAHELVAVLRREMATLGLRYWIVPLLDAGRIE